jgi:uncharacterized protein YuzE
LSILLYDEQSDRLSIELEKHDSKLPLFSLDPIRDLVELNISLTNGQLVSVEIHGLYKVSEGIIPEMGDFWYCDNEDTLYIHLTEEDKDSPPRRDLIWSDTEKHIAIMFNRNEVGNIIGIEVIGVNMIISSTYD